MNDMNADRAENWVFGMDEEGKLCEFNVFTRKVRYPEEIRTLTQQVIDEIVKESDEYIGADSVDDK